MPTVYSFVSNDQSHGETIDSTSKLTWEFCKQLVAWLKAFTTAPWITKGSSRDGSAGTAFSATPDGVDHWVGRLSAAASTGGAQRIWHLLENTVTGIQLCIEVRPASDIRLTVAPNKFVSAGAWRGGGTNATTRPTDTISTPAEGREASTTNITPLVARTAYLSSGTTGYAFSIAHRDDGKGFYAHYIRLPLIQDSTGGVGAFSSFVCGLAPPLTSDPDIDVNNKYMVFYANSDGLAAEMSTGSPPELGSGNFRIEGRRSDATIESYAVTAPAMSSLSAAATGRFPVTPTFLNPNAALANSEFRGGLPDVWKAGIVDGTLPWLQTWNSFAFIKLGRLLFPWDGITNLGGGSKTGYFLGAAQSGGPGPLVVDPRRFNKGMEKI